MLDGMTIDSEGMLWVAVSGGGMLIRVDPKKGEQLSVLHIPTTKPTSCTFGGENLDEIYITTRNEEADKNEKPFGKLFKVKVQSDATLFFSIFI